MLVLPVSVRVVVEYMFYFVSFGIIDRRPCNFVGIVFIYVFMITGFSISSMAFYNFDFIGVGRYTIAVRCAYHEIVFLRRIKAGDYL